MSTTLDNEQSEKERAFEVITQEVLENGGARVFPMGELRDAAGFFKSGKWARQEILSELKKRGLGCCPNPLPHRQEEDVLVYSLDTPWGKKLSS